MEPPLEVSPDGPELQPRKVGHRRLDMLVAFAAITISVVSLVSGVLQGRTQERIQAASTWPLLEYSTSNLEEGQSVIALKVENSGVGPALLKDFAVRYQGRPVRSFGELFQQCCGFAPGVTLPKPGELTREQAFALFPPAELEKLGGAVTGSVRRVYSPGESITFLRYPKSARNASTFDELDRARSEITFDACYCSALDHCWRSDLRSMNPRRVRACPAPGPDSYRE